MSGTKMCCYKNVLWQQRKVTVWSTPDPLEGTVFTTPRPIAFVLCLRISGIVLLLGINSSCSTLNCTIYVAPYILLNDIVDNILLKVPTSLVLYTLHHQYKIGAHYSLTLVLALTVPSDDLPVMSVLPAIVIFLVPINHTPLYQRIHFN